MNVTEFVDVLNKLDPTGKLSVVAVGWFGEALPISRASKVTTYNDVPAGLQGETHRNTFEAIEISVPDKGVEPD